MIPMTIKRIEIMRMNGLLYFFMRRRFLPKILDVQMTETVKGKKHVRMTAPAILTGREMVKLRASGIVPWGIGITCCRC